MDLVNPLEVNILTTRTRMRVLSALNSETERSNEEKIKDQQFKMHARVVNEIIATEKSYIKQLNTLTKFFMKPLLEKALLSSKEFNIVFGKIEGIRHVNCELLKQLNLKQESIGKAFLELAPYLKMYSSYANSFEEAISLIQKLESERKDFADFLHGQESRPEVGTKLNSLLITPVQRVPRYKLLLNELMQHTSCESEDYQFLKCKILKLKITSATREIEFVANHINDCISEHDNMQKMLCIQRSLVDGQPKIMQPGRRFIKEGSLMKTSRKGRSSNNRIFFLFSDMLMYCKLRGTDYGRPNSLVCCCILPIKSCVVEGLFDGDNKQGSLIKLTCKGETLLLHTDNPEEGDSWIAAIKSATRQYSEFRQTLRKESSAKRPLRRAAILKSKMESLSQLSRKRKMEALEHMQPSTDCTTKDSLFPMRELLDVQGCMAPCKKAKLSPESSMVPMGSAAEADVDLKIEEAGFNLSTIEEDSMDDLHGQLALHSGENNADFAFKESTGKTSSDSGEENSARAADLKAVSIAVFKAKRFFTRKSDLSENKQCKSWPQESCNIL